jgi:hypothetical protein
VLTVKEEVMSRMDRLSKSIERLRKAENDVAEG